MMIDKVSMVTPLSRAQHFGPKSAEDKDATEEQVKDAVKPAASEPKPETRGESDVKNVEFAVGDLAVSFEMDREINRVVVTVTDKESGEVIREIPEEEVRELAKHLAEVSGKLLNRTV
ncbi:MAG: flagellar protein FlaG [Deltaproteobacteria bacterium]|nr:flagellar protein FlaG [Deltaproteobacteria bacterium]